MSASHQMLATITALLTVLPSLYLPKTWHPPKLSPSPRLSAEGLEGRPGVL